MNSNYSGGKKDKDSLWQRLFKAIRELSPAGPFEYGPKTLPLPRMVARAIAEEPDSQTNPDTVPPDYKEETVQTEPDKAKGQDQDENINNDEDGSSGQAEQLPD